MAHENRPDAGTTAARGTGNQGAVPVRLPVRGNLVPDGKISCTSEMVREMVRAALVRVSAGERWHFDAGLVMVPNGRGSMVTMYAIVIYTPSARMDLKSFGSAELVDDFPSEEVIMNAVRSAVAKLCAAQSAALLKPVDLSELPRRL